MIWPLCVNPSRISLIIKDMLIVHVLVVLAGCRCAVVAQAMVTGGDHRTTGHPRSLYSPGEATRIFTMSPWAGKVSGF